MTCNAPIFVDDEGTIFRLTVQECINDVLTPVDVSSQTNMDFIFKKPDGSTISPNPTPVFTTNGTDGVIEYTTVTGDIDQAGVWCLQAEVTLPSGIFRTSIVKFDVDEKL
jgi:hypothetical protein